MGVYGNNGSVIITLSLITVYILVGADLHGGISDSERNNCYNSMVRCYEEDLDPYTGPLCYDCTGGLGATAPADEDRQKMCDVMKLDVQWKTRKKYTVFQAKSYRPHHVGGSFYYIKVHVGGEDYIHICLFKDLPGKGGTLRFDGVQEGKTLHDRIVGFDRIEYSYE